MKRISALAIVTSLLLTSALALFATAAQAQVAGQQKISNTEGNFTGMLNNGDLFGWVPTNIGDLDGDGVTDLAVGTPGDSETGAAAGAIWILFLNTDGTVKSHQKIGAGMGGFTGTLDAGDHFGHSLRSIGDFDKDGVIDLAAGALFDDDGGSNRGALWLLFMNRDGTVKSHQKISDTVGGFTDTLNDEDGFGHGITQLTDMNGDGVTELAAATGHITHQGVVWILFMNADGTVRDFTRIAANEGGFTGTLDPDGEFGHDLDELGDLDGDGIIDMVAGVRHDDDGGPDRGAIYILFLNADGTVKGQQKISDTQGGFTGVLDNNDVFGHPAANAGDLDGDGVVDLLVGAPFDDDGGVDIGAFWILFLNPDGTVKAHQKVSQTEGGFTGDLDDFDLFSHIVVSLGDLDGDGNTDYAVGAPHDDDGGTDRGAVWILFGDGVFPPPPPSAQADLTVTKLDTPDPVVVGENLTYTITVQNNGPDEATTVTVADNLPVTVSLVSASASQGSCTTASGILLCSAGSLADGAQATLTVVVTPGSAGVITNSASVSASESDPDAADNTAEQSTTVQTVPGGGGPLSIAGVSPSVLAPGDSVQLTISGSGFQDGARLLICRDGGVTIQSVTAPDPSTMLVNVDVAPSRQDGTCGVRIVNPDGERALARDVITIAGGEPPPPPPPSDQLSIATVTPAVLAPGDSVQLTISGTGFQDGAQLLICRDGGVTIQSVTVPDPGTLLVSVDVAASRQDGTCGVKVTNPDGQRALARDVITISGG